MAQYQDFASVYDRLMHQDIDYGRWCDYIENIFAERGISPDAVLEIACGSGNITRCMLDRGYDITGVDISSDMLAVAASKLGADRLVCADMSKFRSERQYDAVLCMIDGVNYLITPDAVINTFKNVRKTLKDGGVFIFDISSQYKLQNILGNETFIHSEPDVFYSWQNRYVPKYNISDMLLNFFVKEGRGYKRFEERHIQRGWHEKQLVKMLKMAGFTDIGVYNELTFDGPEKDSQRLVFVCS